MTKYGRIANAIQQYILEKELKTNDQLPIITDLVEQFAVSKSTIIKALEVLEIKGVIYQRRGSGSFVRAPKRPAYINLAHQSGIGKDFENFVLTQEVLGVTLVPATKQIADILLIDEETSVFRVKRVTSLNGMKAIFETSYYNTSIVPYLDEDIVKDSIFSYIKAEYHFEYAFSDSYFVLEECDEVVAELLDLEVGSLVMMYEEIFYSADGVPFDYCVSYYHPKVVRFYSGGIPRA